MAFSLRKLAKPWVMVVAVVLLVAVVGGLVWFQPWKLWVDKSVQEAVPTVSAPAAAPTVGATSNSSTAAVPVPVEPVILVSGQLISHEHTTSGSVQILRLADGSQVLRLENLSTSNGPDLHVWLTNAPVIPGREGWHVFDDGAYTSLGRLKGNQGSQNYALPADLDLSKYSSLSIWCDRFNVSFGAASLTQV